jgi:DNA-binding NarL/FixJ family response regulator
MPEQKQVLIAHPSETIRKGLCAIVREELGHEIDEAATGEELQAHMKQRRFDLIVLHQSLVTSSIALPPGRFILLTAEPTMPMFVFARLHGALAYLMESTSRGLLQQALHLAPGAFLNDPAITRWLSDYLAHHELFAISNEVLTAREREIFHLLWIGQSKREIAEQLNIRESTVRTHITHMYEKLKLNRFQAGILELLRISRTGNSEV